MEVRQPSEEFEGAFRALVDDYLSHDPENGESYIEGIKNFSAYVRRLKLDEEGVDMPEGLVACTHRWLVDSDGNIVAVVRTRHHIDHPFLNSVGGHIGYDVPFSQRGNRYSIEALRAGLEVANELGLSEVLVCADAENAASCRTIERCGGVLEKEFLSEHWPIPVRRYWIST